MPDGSPPNPPPNPDDPWLEGLTFEQIAQLVNEISPDVFYQRASAFDQGGARFQDVLDRVRHEMNLVREAWTGKSSEDFDAVVREVTGKISNVLQFLQNPGYGAILRDAGDRLADHQRRFRDLQGQKTAQESTPPAPGAPSPEETAKVNDDSAKQILRDLRTVYWDVGNGLAPLPYKPQAVVTDSSSGTTNNQNPGNGENKPETGTQNHGDTDNFGPTLFGPATSTKTSTHHPGPSGGGKQFLSSGQDRNVLGRVDPGDQGLSVPGQPGPVFTSAQPHENTPAVLGHTFAAARESAPFGETVSGVPPMAAFSPAVLGRSGTCEPGATTTSGRTRGRDKDRKEREAVEEELVLQPEDRPETLSVETLSTEKPAARTLSTEKLSTEKLSAESLPAEKVDTVAEREVVKTAVEAPGPDVTEKAHEIAAQIAATAATSGQPAVTHSLVAPQGAPAAASAVSGGVSGGVSHAAAAVPARPAAAVAGELKHALETDAAGRPLTFALSASTGAGGVTHAIALDPQSRGMFAPGTATPDGLVAQVPADTVTGPNTPGSTGRGATADPYASSQQHMGGFPMGGMMMGGGMGGGNQQNGRMAAMPNEPRPEVWDPLTGAPTAVGRRERQEQEPEKREPELSKEQVQAALAEKFAELDRLMERGR